MSKCGCTWDGPQCEEGENLWGKLGMWEAAVSFLGVLTRRNKQAEANYDKAYEAYEKHVKGE